MIKVSELSSTHDRKGFDCGSRELNIFLQTIARPHVSKGISRTFILAESDDADSIIGFYTLCVCEIITEKMPKEFMKKYPRKIPGIKLARLAVAAAHQKKGYGALMLIDALKRLLSVSHHLGIVGFFVDAKDDHAAGYSQKFGFIPLPDNPQVLFIPMSTIEKAFRSL